MKQPVISVTSIQGLHRLSPITNDEVKYYTHHVTGTVEWFQSGRTVRTEIILVRRSRL